MPDDGEYNQKHIVCVPVSSDGKAGRACRGVLQPALFAALYNTSEASFQAAGCIGKIRAVTHTIRTEIVPLVADVDGVIRVEKTRVTLDTIVAALLDGATAEK